MQMKHLIIFALAGMVILLGFNMINGSRHENRRVATNEVAIPINDSEASTQPSASAEITSKPLGEQPKAIMDKATTEINEAQQADAARLAQMNDAQ